MKNTAFEEFVMGTILPEAILTLIEKIASIKNCSIQYFNNEVSIFAPDPGEKGEQEALDILKILQLEAEKYKLECEVYLRGPEEIDALRIYFSKEA